MKNSKENVKRRREVALENLISQKSLVEAFLKSKKGTENQIAKAKKDLVRVNKEIEILDKRIKGLIPFKPNRKRSNKKITEEK